MQEVEGPPGPRARNYLFTLNNPEGQLFPSDDGWEKYIDFAVWQLEVGEETGTLHIQGYIECNDKRSWKQLHELPGLESANFRSRRGTQKQAIAYCEKPNDMFPDDNTRVEGPWRWGVPKAQGERTDLLEIKRRIDRGEPIVSIVRDTESFHACSRHLRFFREYKRMCTEKRDFKTIVFLFLGPSGVGKSRLISTIIKMLGMSCYKVPFPKGSGLYWDDYDGQEITFIDEFDGNYMRPAFFNLLCDRYECVVPTHGAAGHQFVSKFLFIGTNYHPKFWWRKRNANQLEQTTRRIDCWVPIMHYTQNSLTLQAIAAQRAFNLRLGVSRSPNFIP